jgi:hypothetical protein
MFPFLFSPILLINPPMRIGKNERNTGRTSEEIRWEKILTPNSVELRV